MKTTYCGYEPSDFKFENLEPGDLFIIKPRTGVPNPEAVVIYMKLQAEDIHYNAVADYGHICNLNGGVPVIKLDGELMWKMCK